MTDDNNTEAPDHQPLTDTAMGIASELGLHRSAAVLLLIEAALDVAIDGPCDEETGDDWEYLSHAVVRLAHAILECAWDCERGDVEAEVDKACRETDKALS